MTKNKILVAVILVLTAIVFFWFRSHSVPSGPLRLTVVAADQQNAILQKSSQASFEIYAPAKLPEGFSVNPNSVGGGTGAGGVEEFSAFVSGPRGDNIQIKEYDWQAYLKASGLKEKDILNSKSLMVADVKVYLADSYIINSVKRQYVQGATVISGGTLIRISYFGERKLSDEDLAALAASFVK